MLLSKIIEGRKTVYSRGASSDDIRLSSRYIYDVFLDNRNRVISQKKNKKQFIADYNFEILDCVDMIEVSSIECPSLAHMGCKVKRSKEKIPEILTYENGLIIDWVSDLYNKEIPVQDKRRVKYQLSNRYVGNDFVSIIENGYLYINSKYAPKKIKIKFIAFDPLEVRLKGCISATEVDFPLQGNERDTILQLTDQEIRMFATNREDRQNNSKEEATVYKNPDNDKNR